MIQTATTQTATTQTATAARIQEAGTQGVPVDQDFDNGYRYRYLPQAQTRDMRVDGPAHPDLDPDHHLWKNGTRWWIAITLHAPDWKKTRLRRSLGTADIREARRRRDAILRYFERSTDFDLSLRYARQFA